MIEAAVDITIGNFIVILIGGLGGPNLFGYIDGWPVDCSETRATFEEVDVITVRGADEV